MFVNLLVIHKLILRSRGVSAAGPIMPYIPQRFACPLWCYFVASISREQTRKHSAPHLPRRCRTKLPILGDKSNPPPPWVADHERWVREHRGDPAAGQGSPKGRGKGRAGSTGAPRASGSVGRGDVGQSDAAEQQAQGPRGCSSPWEGRPRGTGQEGEESQRWRPSGVYAVRPPQLIQAAVTPQDF